MGEQTGDVVGRRSKNRRFQALIRRRRGRSRQPFIRGSARSDAGVQSRRLAARLTSISRREPSEQTIEFWGDTNSQKFAMKEKNGMECDMIHQFYAELWFVPALSRTIVVNCRCRVCSFAPLPKISKVCNVPRQRRWRRSPLPYLLAPATTHRCLFLDGIWIYCTFTYLLLGPTLGLIFGRCEFLCVVRGCLAKCCDVIRLGIYASRSLGAPSRAA